MVNVRFTFVCRSTLLFVDLLTFSMLYSLVETSVLCILNATVFFSGEIVVVLGGFVGEVGHGF